MLRIAVGLGAAVSSFLDDSTAPSEAWRGASSGRLGAESVSGGAPPAPRAGGRRTADSCPLRAAGVLLRPQRLQDRPRWFSLAQWHKDIKGPSSGDGRGRDQRPPSAGERGTCIPAVPHLCHRRRPAQRCSAVTPVSCVPAAPGVALPGSDRARGRLCTREAIPTASAAPRPHRRRALRAVEQCLGASGDVANRGRCQWSCGPRHGGPRAAVAVTDGPGDAGVTAAHPRAVARR